MTLAVTTSFYLGGALGVAGSGGLTHMGRRHHVEHGSRLHVTAATTLPYVGAALAVPGIIAAELGNGAYFRSPTFGPHALMCVGTAAFGAGLATIGTPIAYLGGDWMLNTVLGLDDD